jgi:uncharacterized protein YbjT (DUF2867 family)
MHRDQQSKKTTIDPWEGKDIICSDLPSAPLTDAGLILVTGASGYIGGRLVPELQARGYKIRVMVRAASPEYKELWPDADIAVADALDLGSLKKAMKNVDTAYYLIHSLLLGPREFVSTEIMAAINFRTAAEKQKIKRIIYLGGLGDTRTKLSPHLKSRIMVAEELKSGKVPVTILRAAIIIGSGSASYEIIHHLIKNLPILPIPRWAKNKCQPISIRDVIKYLVGVLEIPETSEKYFDIGGNDILTYQIMLKTLSVLLNRNNIFISSPFSYIRVYSYFASLFTPVPAPITRCLIEGLKNEVICQNNEVQYFLPFKRLSYKEAIVMAMTREEQDNVHTSWTGAYPPAHELAIKLHELKDKPKYTVSYSVVTKKKASSLFTSICRIGGKKGWFSRNWMWRMRGMIDKILLGVGSSRGRRSQTSLKINDVIDFWRIEDIKQNRRVLLRAEMKLPGEAWLEFKIQDESGQRKLTVSPYYHTNRLFGKLYWFVLLPFHKFIFTDLIKQIERIS